MKTSSTNIFDMIVIGGGLYGCKTALFFAKKGFKVALVEQNESLLLRASRNNQSRIHNGYHYPRSLMTAIGSSRNYEKFKFDFSTCLIDDFEHIYAIASNNSKINSNQFHSFCKNIGIPLKPTSKSQRSLFDFNRIEEIFLVDEIGINTISMGQNLSMQIEKEKNISLFLNTHCSRAEIEPTHMSVETSSGKLKAQGVMVAAYAQINSFLTASSFKPLKLKVEVTEMALVKRPSSLANIATTIMDGPFFSMMPFGGNDLSTLSHVRYTPHSSSTSTNKNFVKTLQKYKALQNTRFPFMRNDAARYMPAIRKAKYIDSLYELKVVPEKNEIDDGRPILICEHVGTLGGKTPFLISVLGSKLDAIYEWENVLSKHY
ncbi:MAG: FAD-binding oxidoreductase [Hyphomicrobiales bacterium]